MTDDHTDPVRGVLSETSLSKPKARKAANKEFALMTVHVKVYSPQHVYFDELATSISAMNATGPFDILPGHHNFITLLDPCDIDIRRPGKKEPQQIKISGGFMHVKGDAVTVFLDI
jgi:F0F1-type ATP synthase epsilon subunit